MLGVSQAKLAILLPYEVGLYRMFNPPFKPINIGTPGVSDLVGFLLDGSSRWVSVEVKTGNAKLRESQIRFRAVVEKAGGIFIVGRSVQQVVLEITSAYRK